jgi:hypothetical protein
MIDLRPPLNEALGNIVNWRNKYARKEYPHKIVLNIMYRAYSTKFVFEAFSRDELPEFDDFTEAAREVHRFYGQMAATEVHSNLLRWMATKPNEEVGTVCTERLEKLATRAETDPQALEELEFTYIFELLNDMSVLYWIAFRQCGESDVNAIYKMSDVMIRPFNNMDYSMIKQVFQQLLVAPYMNDNYHPLP